MRDWPKWLDEELEQERLEKAQEERRGLPLFWLVLILAAVGYLLYRIGGLPHLPKTLPSLQEVVRTLKGTDPPLEAILYILFTVTWALWLWTVGSLLLSLLVVLSEWLSHGAAWARSLRSLAHRVTMPIARRAVEGALVTVMVVNLVGRSVSSASAAPLPTTRIALVEPDVRDNHLGSNGRLRYPLVSESPRHEPEKVEQTYTVKKGDTLWTIAEHFYGTGYEYKRLVSGNAGRRMPDGRVFTRAGLINPGFVLVIPEPDRTVETKQGKTYYVVQEDDSLRGIAVRFLGDESRWAEIFELNKGKAKLDDRRVLSHPDLIWPGLRLEIPEKAKVVKTPPSREVSPPARVEEPGSSQPRGAQAGQGDQGNAPGIAPTPATPPTQPAPAQSAPAPTAAPPPAQAEPQATPPPASASPLADPTRPQATPPPRTPGPAPTPAVALEPPGSVSPNGSTHGSLDDHLPLYAAGGAAALAAGVGAAHLMRTRRRRRGRSALASVGIPRISGGFAEAPPPAPSQSKTQGEADPAEAVVVEAIRYLEDHGLRRTTLLTAQLGRNSVALTLKAGLAEQERLLALAPELGRHLRARVGSSLTPDRDVLVELEEPRPQPSSSPSAPPKADLALLPIGVLQDRQTLLANWPELGHILVAGLAGGGAETILTSLVGALAARLDPNELGIYIVADDRQLPRQAFELPHELRRADPEDPEAVRALFAKLRAEVRARIQRHRAAGQTRWEPSEGEPRLALVIGELGQLDLEDSDLASAFDLIALEGTNHGVQILAASVLADRLSDYVVAPFTTRLVLRMEREAQSTRLLGDDEAVGLGGGGHMLARLASRTPIQVRGFRISPEHLDELLRLMRGPTAQGVPGTAPSSRPAVVQPPPGGRRASWTSWTTGSDPSEGGAPGSEGGNALAEGSVGPGSEPSAAEEGEGADGSDGEVQPREVEADSDDDDGEEDAADVTRSGGEREPGELTLETPSSAEFSALRILPNPDEADNEAETEDDGRAPRVARQREPDGLEVAADERANGKLAPELVDADEETAESADLNGSHAQNPPQNGSSAALSLVVPPRQLTNPLVTIQLFGGYVVNAGERELVGIGEGGAQYKAWAILAYVAAHPDGEVSRDKLLGTFWPEGDPDRAQNALYVALNRVRRMFEAQSPGLGRALKKDLLKIDREGICHLGHPVVSSDVQESVRLCQEAWKVPTAKAKAVLERARSLYGGHLLLGRGAGWYSWVDERDEGGVSLRDRYRAEYRKASRKLAGVFREEGEYSSAIAIYRSLLEDSPIQEDVVRDLFLCYRETGDLGLLVREERHLRESLRAAYQDPDGPLESLEAFEPDLDTMALFEEVRRELEADDRRRRRRQNGRGGSGR